MNLNELKLAKKLSEINYSDLLDCEERKSKREEILYRDNYKCKNCNRPRTHNAMIYGQMIYFYYNAEKTVLYQSDNAVILHVHHHLYIRNKLPWEYNNKYLVTLCHTCHETYHKNNVVEVWSQNQLHKEEFGYCVKCDGSGFLEQYSHVQSGICFQCYGCGYDAKIINLEEI